MDHGLRPARVVQPHRILKQELEARGWTEADFARSLGCSRQVAVGLLSGTALIPGYVANACGRLRYIGGILV